jgi:PAS domain S-box-containing protein
MKETNGRQSREGAEGAVVEPTGELDRGMDRFRSVAQLNMLHSLAAKLNALGDVQEIGNAITAELRTIVDYHNCRVYLVEPDQVTLMPVAFRGELFKDYEEERLEDLITTVGEGLTGHVAATGESLLTPNAQEVSFAVQIEGTEDIVESMLLVPMKLGETVLGVIVLSSLGLAKFDEDDQRLLEVLASHAAVAFENARRLSELERFHELVESLDAVFWEADADTLAFTFVGGRTGDLLGTDADTWPAQGRTWGEHIAPEDRDEALAASHAASEAGEAHTLEYRVVRTGDADPMWVRDVINVVQGTKGPPHLRGLMVDVTERKRAEHALQQSERQYSEAFRREREAAQRLRALDDMKNTFLEAVSHDLRTPLTSILGSALTLEQAGVTLSQADSADLVRRIASNARKLERLLSDLLDLDRLQRGIIAPQRRPTDIVELIRRGIEETDNPSGHIVQVEVEPLTVSVDGAKVERIFENLLSNAIRHTPPEAKVWVRVHGQDGGVLIEVEDEGPGVPEELHEAVFEPFRQAPGSVSEHSPGVGIGLSLVLRFAELHGGRAWMEDRPGGGASFKVFLPAG